MEDDRDYHMARARSELDLAYRAERDDVARAHMELSALHMRRLRDLDEGGGVTEKSVGRREAA